MQVLSARPILVTVSHGAAMLGMKPYALMQHVEAGRIPAAKQDGRWLILPRDLEAFPARLVAEQQGWVPA